jgi:dGTP triphosphohydrolase
LLYCKLQLVTDQVAGMTDTYACHLHKELSNG